MLLTKLWIVLALCALLGLGFIVWGVRGVVHRQMRIRIGMVYGFWAIFWGIIHAGMGFAMLIFALREGYATWLEMG